MSANQPLQKCKNCPAFSTNVYCKPCHVAHMNSMVCVFVACGYQCNRDYCRYRHDIKRNAFCETSGCENDLHYDSNNMSVYRKCSECYEKGSPKTYYTKEELYQMCMSPNVYAKVEKKSKSVNTVRKITKRNVAPIGLSTGTSLHENMWERNRPPKIVVNDQLDVYDEEETSGKHIDLSHASTQPSSPSVISDPELPPLEDKTSCSAPSLVSVDTQTMESVSMVYKSSTWFDEDISFNDERMNIIAREESRDGNKCTLYLTSSGVTHGKVFKFELGHYLFIILS